MGEGLQPAIRASDAERDATVIRLRDAMAEGRLTLDDFSERTDAALTALTRDQLSAVVADLPTAAAPAAIVAQTAGWDPWVVGIMGSARRTGRWRVGHQLHAVSLMGDCKIDLREAIIDASVITVDALAIMGSVEVIVPPGVEVDFGPSPLHPIRRKAVLSAHIAMATPPTRLRSLPRQLIRPVRRRISLPHLHSLGFGWPETRLVPGNQRHSSVGRESAHRVEIHRQMESDGRTATRENAPECSQSICPSSTLW